MHRWQFRLRQMRRQALRRCQQRREVGGHGESGVTFRSHNCDTYNTCKMDSITRLPTPTPPSLPPPIESYGKHRDVHTPIIIDNGSTTLRWGFATSTLPRTAPNTVAKYKERRSNKPLLLFGESIEVESGAKAQAKTPWENDVLLNFDAFVCCPACIIIISCSSLTRDIGKRFRLRLC